MADCFESFVGALFIDQGIEAVSEFLGIVLLPKADEIIKGTSFKDPKSLLQELVQSRRLNSPAYKVLGETGPAHAKRFRIGAFVDGNLISEGEGKSKKDAQEDAASKALEYYQASTKAGVEKKSK